MKKLNSITFWTDDQLQSKNETELINEYRKKFTRNSGLTSIHENKIHKTSFSTDNRTENQNSFQTVKLSDEYSKYLKITGFCWLCCAITMIIMSYIGYTSPKQKSGYTCLRSVDVKKSYSESCTFTDECITSLGLKCSIINGNCT
jgi:hypothetical protein